MLRIIPTTSLLLLFLTIAASAAEPVSVGTYSQEVSRLHTSASGLPGDEVTSVHISNSGDVYAHAASGWAVLKAGSDVWERSSTPRIVRRLNTDVRRRNRMSRRGRGGRAMVRWTNRIPGAAAGSAVTDGDRSWYPRNPLVVRDGKGRYWIADQQGVGCLENGQWTLYSGDDGVPFTDFTCAAVDSQGVLWLGTTKGVVRYDGQHWAYRQGRRWLPGDHVHSIALADDGTAWIATDGGISQIEFQDYTLAQKARFYEEEIDKYNRRTEFGYVLEARAVNPGDKSEVSNHDSDNDGLWTAMYGAGECYAWAATQDPDAKRRAVQAFEALRFLSVAPRGGSNPAPRGFIARTVVPTSEPNPNEREGYTLEGQQKNQQENDRMWRAYTPRWPTTEDGKYYWKSDTSSDELDGHYYFYGLYYDLVADTEEEKERVREIVRDNINHMIDHGFRMHDHAGPTRWADYSPESLNNDPRWAMERGLNSLSMLSYLATAAHITGDNRYREVAAELREKHHYAQNLLVPKIQVGLASGNQSDDEMAFMCFYNLMKYEDDPQLNLLYRYSFHRYWQLEFPELNPFFNFCYAVGSVDAEYANQWGAFSLAPDEGWLEDSVDTLRRFPLDRFDWKHENSHRIDLMRIPGPGLDARGRMMRTLGKVIPVDECHFNHWNRNPWEPDTGGNGNTLSSGTVFLLPYYMGLYHGFIAE